MSYSKNNKGQMKMTESILIIIVFFILLIVGFSIYVNFKSDDIEANIDSAQAIRAEVIANRIPQYQDFSCSKEMCIMIFF